MNKEDGVLKDETTDIFWYTVLPGTYSWQKAQNGSSLAEFVQWICFVWPPHGLTRFLFQLFLNIFKWDLTLRINLDFMLLLKMERRWQPWAPRSAGRNLSDLRLPRKGHGRAPHGHSPHSLGSQPMYLWIRWGHMALSSTSYFSSVFTAELPEASLRVARSFSVTPQPCHLK